MSLYAPRSWPILRVARGTTLILSAIGLAVLGLSLESAAEEGSSFEFKRIDPENLNVHPFYSQATTVQGPAKCVYVAGQTDRAPEYTYGSDSCRHEDWRGQYLGVHENVEKALHASGAGWNDVVFIRRFVTDIKAFRHGMSDRQDPPPNYWAGHRPPPSTLIEVSALSEPCQLIEIDVFAVVEAR